jgi:DNA modification methylase
MNKIEFGDCRETMRRWASEGIKAQTCVTSPPYYGLRDYGTAKWEGGNLDCDHTGAKVNPLKVGGFTGERLRKEGGSENEKYLSYKKLCPDCNAVRVDSQIGIEETPEEYIAAMVEVFRCVKDVLADDGTLWVNIGDSYAGSGGAGNQFGQLEKGLTKYKQGGKPQDFGCKPKDLIGIPWMLAFALRADGWYLRQDIIWHKPNPMPESVKDRCTKSHEYIFLLSKSKNYYFDSESIKEEATSTDESNRDRDESKLNNTGRTRMAGLTTNHYEKKNKRSVWNVATKPYSGAHFAVFPSDLIDPCILAGAPVGGIVLDPFMGSGTTAQVAQNLGRQYMGCELNLEYKKLQDQRLAQESFAF